MVVICINLVVLEYPMLYTKFQGHRPFGSRKDLLRFLTIYGHGGHFDQVTNLI